MKEEEKNKQNKKQKTKVNRILTSFWVIKASSITRRSQ